MAIPTYDQFIIPLLRVLGEQTEPMRARDVYAAVAALLDLTPEEKAKMLPSKIQAVYVNRIGWAHDALKRSLLSSSPKRGYWLLTPDGQALHRQYPEGISPDHANRIANKDRRTPIAELVGGETSDTEVEEDSTTQSPEEQIDSGLAALKTSVGHDLLEIINRGTPEFFEMMVLRVLHAMGYGQSEDDLQQVGRSGDGGIDGIISLDRLGLEKVYVQAKKWQGQVGSPQIQGFMGALQLQGANKGVLITSGSISGPAWDAAKQARGSVVLIDGPRLAALMIEHEVGITPRIVKIPKIDMDFFEDE